MKRVESCLNIVAGLCWPVTGPVFGGLIYLKSRGKKNAPGLQECLLGATAAFATSAALFGFIVIGQGLIVVEPLIKRILDPLETQTFETRT